MACSEGGGVNASLMGNGLTTPPGGMVSDTHAMSETSEKWRDGPVRLIREPVGQAATASGWMGLPSISMRPEPKLSHELDHCFSSDLGQTEATKPDSVAKPLRPFIRECIRIPCPVKQAKERDVR